jgi:serine/threonine protein kinase
VDRPQIGTEFAGYLIEAVAGRGGASIVYEALNLRLGNRVALKVLSPELSDDDQFRERFVRESKIAAQITHPNIIPIIDAGASGGYLYIAMRYVEGADLKAQLTAHGRLSPERTMRIVRQVARALDTANDRGLVHRDVKPANVLLEEVGSVHEHVYLADFGLTKRTGSHTGLTSSGHFVGTIDYMAPEQIEGGDVDRRADVYALAGLVYQCLTGMVPFPKDTEMAVLWAHMNEPPPPASSRNPAIPAAADGVLARGMAKSRDDRFPSCGELVTALDDALGLTGVSSEIASHIDVANPAVLPPDHQQEEPITPAPVEAVEPAADPTPTLEPRETARESQPSHPMEQRPPVQPGAGGAAPRRTMVAAAAAVVLALLTAGMYELTNRAGGAASGGPGGSSGRTSPHRLTGPLGDAVSRMLVDQVTTCTQDTAAQAITCGPARVQWGSKQFAITEARFQSVNVADRNRLFAHEASSARAQDSALAARNRGKCNSDEWDNQDEWFHQIVLKDHVVQEIQDGTQFRAPQFLNELKTASDSGDWGEVMCYRDGTDWVIEWTESTTMDQGGMWFIGRIAAPSQEDSVQSWFYSHHQLMG